MEDYELNVVYRIKFKRGIKKALNVSSYKELNGYYDYDSDKIVINICSNDYEDLNENDIIKQFKNTITHELLHREIYKITNKIANSTEEKFMELMSYDN